MTEADLTAIEERNTRAIGFNHHALTDIPRLLSEVRSLQALERTAWADYQACAAERDRLTLDLHSARQMVTDTHAALERSEAENARLRQERADALSVTSRDGLLSSEWVLRTGQAERRVAELEALISRHEHTVQTDSRGKLCPECACAKDDGWRPQLPPHRADCPWGQAAANHRARQPVEGRDYERML